MATGFRFRSFFPVSVVFISGLCHNEVGNKIVSAFDCAYLLDTRLPTSKGNNRRHEHPKTHTCTPLGMATQLRLRSLVPVFISGLPSWEGGMKGSPPGSLPPRFLLDFPISEGDDCRYDNLGRVFARN